MSRVTLVWTETGGRTAADCQPSAGFGRTLLERAVPAHLGAERESVFGPEGYRYALNLPAKALA